MLVETMTPKEMRKEIQTDLQELESRLENYYPKARKWAMRQTKFPCAHIWRVKSKNGNNFFGVISVNNKSDIRRRNMLSSHFYATMNTANGLVLITDMCNYRNHVTIGSLGYEATPMIIINPHVFKRYRERFGVLDGYKDIYEQFLLRNREMTVTTSIINGKHGEQYDNIAVAKDGVLLGTSSGGIVETIRTFLTYKELNQRQNKYFNFVNDEANKTLRLYDYFQQKVAKRRESFGLE